MNTIKINIINKVINDYFVKNKGVFKVKAKELMSQFINSGVFDSNYKDGLPIRKMLRDLDENNKLHLIPFVLAERKAKNTNWYFVNLENGNEGSEIVTPKDIINKAKIEVKTHSRESSDEYYVMNLCNKALGLEGLPQHRFDFLVGDANKNGKQTKLPVDVYYPTLNLVIEYKEYQHSNRVNHFDKPNIITISGVHRGEQRKIYDQRRVEVLPEHGIKLIEIPFTLFDCDRRNKIVRSPEVDLKSIIKYLDKLKN
jgi:hypothetical protein